MKLRILYVGYANGTCLQRARALTALGHELDHVSSGPPATFWGAQWLRLTHRLRRPGDPPRANRRLLEQLNDNSYDILWIDKGNSIRAATLREVAGRWPGMARVAYSPDDMTHPLCHSSHYLEGIGQYHVHVTTKTHNVDGLKALGARDTFFTDKGFDPEVHRPLELTDEDRRTYGAEVGFVGQYEEDRARQMLELARAGIPVRIWGPGWHEFRESHEKLDIGAAWLDRSDYARALNAAKINLGFLRKFNRDQQTARSVEIPACGAFMLAERTDEHLRLFTEGQEAEYFASFDELLRKCRHYLTHDDERTRIAAAARRRCLSGGYSNPERLARVLDYVVRTYLPDHPRG